MSLDQAARHKLSPPFHTLPCMSLELCHRERQTPPPPPKDQQAQKMLWGTSLLREHSRVGQMEAGKEAGSDDSRDC